MIQKVCKVCGGEIVSQSFNLDGIIITRTVCAKCDREIKEEINEILFV